MRNSFILVGLFLVGLLLVGCDNSPQNFQRNMEYETENPLTAEYIADQMIEYVTVMQIRADERDEVIDDPVILRAIDDVFVKARVLQKEASDRQRTGKAGVFIGKNRNYAVGETLLAEKELFFGYEFEVSAAPDVEILLAKHVAPSTEEELFSESTINLGYLQSYRGAQRYSVGTLSDDDWNEYRTVVLYSPPLRQIIGTSQIRGVVR